VTLVAGAELAAAQEPGGPRGPVDASWLILQRLSDLKEQMADLRRAQDEVRVDVKALNARIESVRTHLDAKIESVRTDLDARIESVRTHLDARIESVRADLAAKIESVRGDLRADAKALDAEVESVRRDTLGLWRWSLALLLVPILGLLAKLLIPGA
jgi:DNA repair exonuclease SbcCD ATPase subunit